MLISDWSSDVCSSELFGSLARQCAEVIALGNEIGLAVDFDDRDRLVIAGNCEHAFGRGAAGFLVGLGRAVHAQLFNCLVEVATGGVERLLAVAHAGASTFAQLDRKSTRLNSSH